MSKEFDNNELKGRIERALNERLSAFVGKRMNSTVRDHIGRVTANLLNEQFEGVEVSFRCTKCGMEHPSRFSYRYLNMETINAMKAEAMILECDSCGASTFLGVSFATVDGVLDE